MRIAVPIDDGRLAMHFGRCAHVVLFTVDDGSGEIVDQQMLPTPPHEPGVFPRWLQGHGVDLIIAGGMGRRAIQLLTQAGIGVVVGAPEAACGDLVNAYLAGSLPGGVNACTHGPDHRCPN